MDSVNECVYVKHNVKNCSLWDIKLAAWGISAMAPGGIAIVKLRSKCCEDICTPNLRACFWPLSSVNDSRLIWMNDFVLLRQDIKDNKSFKIGLLSDPGWIAYLNGNDLFVKYYNYKKYEEYPDFGSTVELYTNERFSEIETLSPMAEIKPGESISHTEKWKLFKIEKPLKELPDEHFLNSSILPVVLSGI